MGAAVVLGACAALVTFAVYIPALRNSFVNWDDSVYVYENLRIRSIDPGFLKWVLTAVVSSNWHPLTIVSHAMDYALWGLNPVGHHLTSIIAHAINTFLVALLCFRLVSRGHTPLKLLGPGALATGVAAALLFGLHPLHVESVAWVSERKDVLSAFFFLLSLLAYLRYASGVRGSSLSSGRFSYAASLVLFGLALISKPMAISLPVVLLILDYYPLERFSLKGGRVLLEKLPFFALSGASAVVTLLAQKSGASIVSIDAITFTERIAVAVRGYGFYIYKTFLPIKLAPFYPIPPEGEFFNLWFFASLALLIAITVFCIYTAVCPAKKKRVFLAAWLYFAITLLPVIGLVQVGLQGAADRYMYLPSVGPFVLAGLGAGWLFKEQRIARSTVRARAVAIAVMVIISALMAYKTVRQTRVWKDSVTLWSYEISVYPDARTTAYNNRGLAYEAKGELLKAIADYDMATRINPEDMNPYLNRGIAYGIMGDYRRAINEFNKALGLVPGNRKARMNRGVAYLSMGDYLRAAEDLERAVRGGPDDPIGYYDLGLVYLKLGERDRAAANLKRAAAMGLEEAASLLAKEGLY